LNRRSAALYGAELTQPGYQQRIAESRSFPSHSMRSMLATAGGNRRAHPSINESAKMELAVSGN